MAVMTLDEYSLLVTRGRESTPWVAAAISVQLLADQLTPVLAYRRLVAPDQRTAPSFLLESVEGGERQGRYSLLGSRPLIRVTSRVAGSGPGAGDERVSVRDPRGIAGGLEKETDPLAICRQISERITLAGTDDHTLPACFLGGWVGYASYDTVRTVEPEKLAAGPPDDRNLPDVDFSFYDGCIVFDHVAKIVHVIQFVIAGPRDEPRAVYAKALDRLHERIDEIQRHSRPLGAGLIGPTRPARELPSNLSRDDHRRMVAKAKEYIRAGDIFQVVLGQRFERVSGADPFDVYRALRAVNPSPYMVYLQGEGCILVASSPEILCRVHRERGGELVVTNRPLAGTRRRGTTHDEDIALERELLADPKERAEHIMLVDLGRNDVGRVCEPGSVALPAVMQIERYSHVMHISSTVTGKLRAGLDCWDALRAALPVGTISGAPEVRAMQIIDELEPVRRGPYGGGMGVVGLDGQMDIALALRTIVVPHALERDGVWTYHLQASGGIVADSDPDAEFAETVNKAAALARAIDVAEDAFGVARP